MIYYIDNFRGFQDQYIKLKSVNFFVGENSSGKTSLISAIAILSDFRFWLSGEIASEQIEYKSYEDLFSLNSTREYFTMGLIDNETDQTAHLLSFKDVDGFPMVFREIITSPKSEILVIEKNNAVVTYISTSYTSIKDNSAWISKILDFVDSKEFKKQKQKALPFGNLKGQNLPYSAYRQLIDASDPEIHKKYEKIRNYSSFFNLNVSYLAPIRAKPLPLYSGGRQAFSPEGSHSPFVLKEMISKQKEESDFIKVLTEYGRESGLFDSISASVYGDKKTSPFELLVEKSKSKYRISSVGYGVSQVLPIVTELLANQSMQMITIQQPEVHLHPKAQAAFGMLLFKMAQKYKKRTFIVETHSDYIIDRFRYLIKENSNKLENQVLFFKNDGKHNKIQLIRIMDDGKYESAEIEEYRSFFIDESFKIMEI